MEPTEGARTTMTVDEMCEVISAATKALEEKNAEIERLRNAIKEMMTIVDEHNKQLEERVHNG